MSFSNLGLSPKVEAAVEAAGFDIPTPIQASAIPIAVTGRDVLGIAQTGTGKTASFVLPMLTRLERGRARARMPRTLILEPTRELAAQVAEAFELLGKSHKLTVALLIGGVSYDEQDKKLDRGADVVIATPGRLLDHRERGKLLLNGVEILVVDEADRMLDMGFIPDIERICKMLPFTRQTLFFSATMPPEIARLADNFLHNPERIEVSRRPPPRRPSCNARRRPTSPPPKRQALRELMKEVDVKNAIIFCNRKKDVGVVFRSLQRHGFNVGALHGDMDQRQRTATLDAFRNGTIAFLAASDVAARGSIFPRVSHIFNYDVPVHPEDYIHRIGRTGRAGREGFAAMLVTPKDRKALKAIEAMLRQEIPWLDGASTSSAPEEPAETETSERGNGRGRGARRSRRGGRNRPALRARQNRLNATRRRRRRQALKPPKATAGHLRPAEGNGRPQKAAEGNGRSQKPREAQGRDGRREKQGSKDDSRRSDQPQAKARGMGDHVPAFMMRSVRVP
ncbi:hypothetical protein AUC71_00325 [Methyloceanibacter marginalis]|uniref:DEAD-box ATP-dependent RNA helicase RhpA n=1 Tax=Methyloceanibacter marginalis TaxID=1774971 RepID=A0A1E3VWF3_9HYPH|nr:DEAD/DEAH box helicase [Methyloceanibacter marginalis]ODR97860.1 hypothetical protein AUC71_00325 [Methyloceanibacter marginalis]